MAQKPIKHMIQRRRPRGHSIDQWFCSECNRTEYSEFVCTCKTTGLTKEDIDAIAKDGADGRLTNKNKKKLKQYVETKGKETSSNNTAE